MKKYLKIASLVVIAVIFIGTFIFLYSKSTPKVKQYEIVSSERTDVEKTTVATGKVEPRDEILIKPQISGIISEILKEAGDYVKVGDVIATVQVVPDVASLNSAESRMQLARISLNQIKSEYERQKDLFAKEAKYPDILFYFDWRL